jgi:hypothetical protein
MHIPPAEVNFKEGGTVGKPLIIEDYTTHLGYAALNDSMMNSYSISKKTSIWMQKLFFQLLDLTILNSYILYKYCEGNMTYMKFREQLVRDCVVFSNEENTEIRGVPRGRPSSSETQMSRHEEKYSLHWPAKGKERCHLCQMKEEKTVYYCKKCD